MNKLLDYLLFIDLFLVLICSTLLQSQKPNDLFVSKARRSTTTVIQVYAPTTNVDEAKVE